MDVAKSVLDLFGLTPLIGLVRREEPGGAELRATLEGGVDGVAFASGLAALEHITELLGIGDGEVRPSTDIEAIEDPVEDLDRALASG